MSDIGECTAALRGEYRDRLKEAGAYVQERQINGDPNFVKENNETCLVKGGGIEGQSSKHEFSKSAVGPSEAELDFQEKYTKISYQAGLELSPEQRASFSADNPGQNLINPDKGDIANLEDAMDKVDMGSMHHTTATTFNSLLNNATELGIEINANTLLERVTPFNGLEGKYELSPIADNDSIASVVPTVEVSLGG